MSAMASPRAAGEQHRQCDAAGTCPPLSSLNHVSFLCADVEHTKRFYRDLLGFIEVKRPDSFKFEGSWLLGHGGIAIHLISGSPPLKPRPINPQDVHISFLSPDLDAVEAHLSKHHVPTVRATVFEAGTRVTQVFCHDPDHNMLEFCNCNCLPITPLSSLQGVMGGALADLQHEDMCRDRLSRDSLRPSTEAVNVPSMSSGSLSE